MVGSQQLKCLAINGVGRDATAPAALEHGLVLGAFAWPWTWCCLSVQVKFWILDSRYCRTCPVSSSSALLPSPIPQFCEDLSPLPRRKSKPGAGKGDQAGCPVRGMCTRLAQQACHQNPGEGSLGDTSPPHFSKQGGSTLPEEVARLRIETFRSRGGQFRNQRAQVNSLGKKELKSSVGEGQGAALDPGTHPAGVCTRALIYLLTL